MHAFSHDLPGVSGCFETVSTFNGICGACYAPEPCLRAIPHRLCLLTPQQGRPARLGGVLPRPEGERCRDLQRPTSRGNEVRALLYVHVIYEYGYVRGVVWFVLHHRPFQGAACRRHPLRKSGPVSMVCHRGVILVVNRCVGC